METIIFGLPGNELLTDKISTGLNITKGESIIRKFPDGESYVRVISDVKGKDVILLCTLHEPDDKLLSLFFLSKNLRDLGAKKIRLVAPYLAYMRQDKKFNPGEALTSNYFASLISSSVDELITIDPHLHRRRSLSEIYSIPCSTLHASGLISKYIQEEIEKPLLIGPDNESGQWVSEVAKNAGAPFIVLQKERYGDKEVNVTVPHVEKFKDHTPVLVDDIISTAHTLIETIKHLKKVDSKPPVCIGIHAIFAGNAYEELKNSGAQRIVTCNTIPHSSNKIDISPALINLLK
jgi:ribose-phosphate pyrophosphokinase